MDESTKQSLALGREYYANQDWERAEQMLRAVLEKEDRFADVHNMMGVIHHDRGRFEEAQASFEAALAINPNYTEAALNLAVTYNDLGRYDEAKRIYQAALARGADAPGQLDPFVKGKIANLHAEVAQAYVDVGMIADAKHELRKAVLLCPTFADLRLKLANLYRQTGDLDAAKEAHSRALAAARVGFGPAHPETAIIQQNLGDDYLYGLHLEEAERELTSSVATLSQAKGPEAIEVVTGRTDLGFAHLLLGRVEEAERDFEVACAAFEKTHPKHPNRAMALVGRSDVGERRGKPPDVASLELAKTFGGDLPPFDNVSTEVTVKAVEPNKRILVEWSGYSKPNEVEWVFKELPEGTFVEITNSGFGGNDNQRVQEALDSTGGFTLVIAGLKARAFDVLRARILAQLDAGFGRGRIDHGVASAIK